MTASHSLTKTSLSWKLRPSCLHFTTSDGNVFLSTNNAITCSGSGRFNFISVLFSFQIAPLIVIVGGASLGAIAFGVRQAMRNPEAWYVSY